MEFRGAVWSMAVAAGLLTGCSAPATAPAASHGPCHDLSEGRVAFPTAGAGRVTFAIADRYGTTNVRITGCVKVPDGYAQEWEASGYTGSAGFGRPGEVRVNSLLTPTGSYTLTEAFGRENPGTALEYHQLNRASRWGGAPGPDYNRYFEGEGRWPDEDLWAFMEAGLYEQAAVINYNRPPDMEPEHGLSFAIFLHAGMEESWGCISTDVGTVTRLLRDAVPGDRIVMGVDDDVFVPPPPAKS